MKILYYKAERKTRGPKLFYTMKYIWKYKIFHEIFSEGVEKQDFKLYGKVGFLFRGFAGKERFQRRGYGEKGGTAWERKTDRG